MANRELREMADLLERVVPRLLEIEASAARIGSATVGGSDAAEQAIRTANQLLGGAAVGGSSGSGGAGGFGGIQRAGTSEGEFRIVRTLEDGFRRLETTIRTGGGGGGGASEAFFFSKGAF